jgi:hypothetical protein
LSISLLNISLLETLQTATAAKYEERNVRNSNNDFITAVSNLKSRVKNIYETNVAAVITAHQGKTYARNIDFPAKGLVSIKVGAMMSGLFKKFQK